MATMPLLTPAESLKFESALLNYSNAIAAPEWTMYAGEGAEDYTERLAPSHREGSEQLARATKDLISLDATALRWTESADREVLSASLPATSPQTSFKFSLPAPYAISSPHPRLPSPLQQYFNGPSPSLQRPPMTVVPNRTMDNSAASDSQQSLSSVSSDLTPPPPTPPPLKRPYTSSSDLCSLVDPSPSAISTASGSASRQESKKARSSPPHQQGPVLNTKPSLLTPSQKKANHIQSEQKRRANIRRGYEALCETVPALREAIIAEEQELAEAAENEKGLRGKSKKKGRGKRGVPSEPGEKIDGRAGPRSENIVLQKTIDYIHELLAERKALLERLNRARCKLPHGHSALVPLQEGEALWEREWTGGTGTLDDCSSDDEDGT